METQRVHSFGLIVFLSFLICIMADPVSAIIFSDAPSDLSKVISFLEEKKAVNEGMFSKGKLEPNKEITRAEFVYLFMYCLQDYDMMSTMQASKEGGAPGGGAPGGIAGGPPEGAMQGGGTPSGGTTGVGVSASGAPGGMPAGGFNGGASSEAMPAGGTPGSASSAKAETFSDMAEDVYYAKAVNAALSSGYTKGMSDKSFEPDDRITRQDAATVIVNSLTGGSSRLRISKKTKDNSILSKYGDGSSVAEYAREAVSILLNTGVMAASGRIDPKGFMTRAQAVKILYDNYSAKEKRIFGDRAIESSYADVMDAAIVVDDGVYDMGASVKSSILSGTVGDSGAEKVVIVSDKTNQGGILGLGSKTKYTVIGADITINGNTELKSDQKTPGPPVDGSNYGVTAGAAAASGAIVTVKDSRIISNGAKTTAAAACVDGTLIIDGSYLETTDPGSRTLNTTTKGRMYLSNSTIVAAGWGAVSTDRADYDVKVFVDNCRVTLKRSSPTARAMYAFYADGYCTVDIKNTIAESCNNGGIIAGTGKYYITDSHIYTGVGAENGDANVEGYGFRITNVESWADEIGVIHITGGVLNSKVNHAIAIHSSNADVVLDGVDISSDNGYLIEVARNERNKYPVPKEGVEYHGVQVTMKDMNPKGDIHYSDPEHDMILTLNHATITGNVINEGGRSLKIILKNGANPGKVTGKYTIDDSNN